MEWIFFIFQLSAHADSIFTLTLPYRIDRLVFLFLQLNNNKKRVMKMLMRPRRVNRRMYFFKGYPNEAILGKT